MDWTTRQHCDQYCWTQRYCEYQTLESIFDSGKSRVIDQNKIILNLFFVFNQPEKLDIARSKNVQQHLAESIFGFCFQVRLFAPPPVCGCGAVWGCRLRQRLQTHLGQYSSERSRTCNGGNNQRTWRNTSSRNRPTKLSKFWETWNFYCAHSSFFWIDETMVFIPTGSGVGDDFWNSPGWFNRDHHPGVLVQNQWGLRGSDRCVLARLCKGARLN